MPHLRLVTDEPEVDPPAPLPIDSWRRANGDETDSLSDPIADVERAMSRMQAGLDSLSTQLDDAEPLPFPPGRHDDDDGPWAA